MKVTTPAVNPCRPGTPCAMQRSPPGPINTIPTSHLYTTVFLPYNFPPLPFPSLPFPTQQTNNPSPHPSTPHLTPDKRENNHTRLPKHAHAQRQRLGQPPPRRRRVAQQDPDGEQRDGEEMVEEDEGAADDAGQQADRPVDALPAALEVAETAALQGFELGVWR
jgi:hypothetical protein